MTKLKLTLKNSDIEKKAQNPKLYTKKHVSYAYDIAPVESSYHTFEIPLPGVNPARFNIPKGLNDVDWEILKTLLDALLNSYRNFEVQNRKNTES